jgi:hypothetical protein
VVTATMIANAVALALVFVLTSAAGMRWRRTTLLMALLPPALWLGGYVTLGVVAGAVALGCWRGWLVTPAERVRLVEILTCLGKSLRDRPAPRVPGRPKQETPAW